MASNRIRRYTKHWSVPPSPAAPAPGGLPPGFTMLCLTHLTPAEQRRLEEQRQIYQWAFDEAQRKVDEEFINNWII
jgi:hypothetical protein